MLPSENEDNALQIKEKSTERITPFFCDRSYSQDAYFFIQENDYGLLSRLS